MRVRDAIGRIYILRQTLILLKLVLTIIGNCRNVRGLGKSMAVFSLFEKLRYSNERSTIFENRSI